MTFEQLTKVLQDGIVDDEIVFRAFWQREAFERLLRDDGDHDDIVDEEASDERQAALNDFFDVSDSDERRRQMLLGTPKYRFCMSLELSPPSIENGWIRGDCVAFNDDSNDKPTQEQEQTSRDHKHVIWRKKFYSQPEAIWGATYRVQIEAQVIPRHLMVIQEHDDEKRNNGENSTPSQLASSEVSRQPRIRYTIHCLNQREGLIENRLVDPEDRVLVAVTDMSEDEDNTHTGYVGQVWLDGCDFRGSIKVDAVVCLEVHGA
ncbi:hypothetical protein BDB00DRAFT_753149 [Zychaea mexicana]|uniref:uncharacterized protein n=1 Tax=Zychaea mexicana TaxID=64656 RepID=UPI0022FEC48D|nr:uncharacterized protein BDB00DRAFT_753149 [Zychaea mexicana]KAI9499468.1 hypothetical protein BDB00DRAFT_753149 [Zychaea mexicana]